MSPKSRVLFVLTSASDLLGGAKSGWYLPEAAYSYEVLSPDFEVDFASPAGPNPPIDPESVEKFTDDTSTKFLRDEVIKNKLANAKRLADVSANDHDAIYYVSGHCPVIDLASDPGNSKVATYFYKRNKPIAAICHGPAGLLSVKGDDGKSIFDGKEVTCFSNKEEDTTGKKENVPFLLETRIRGLGGNYVCAEPWKEKIAVSGNLITGQNPASAYLLARALKEKLGEAGPLEKAKEKMKQAF